MSSPDQTPPPKDGPDQLDPTPDGPRTETLAHPPTRSRADRPQIDGFRIGALLGRGGMGQVWLATQEGEAARQVAIKVLRDGRAASGVERFRIEQAALARMSHPNVATVYQVGADRQGRPYIAMERIDGEAITTFCSRRALTVDQRLALFCQACAGVLHAHQSGLVHRDIKPSNVLVAEVDDQPIVKVIDFGIAKDLQVDRREKRDQKTRTGQLLGTPAYMSPEQRMGAGVDTRSDVFSLGALLHEMLLGDPPAPEWTASSTATGGSDSRSRPSDLLDSHSGTVSTGLEWNALKRRLRGDLDAILLMALHRDREQRYQSVSELRRDVERHLSQEPVAAANPSALGLMQKWIRRHRTAAATILLALAGLTAALVLVLRFAWAADQARHLALEEATRARAVEDFLLDDVLGQNDRDFGLGPDATIREVLERAEGEVSRAFLDDPAIHASLRNLIGKMFRNLGERETARRHLTEAWQLGRRELGDQHPVTLSTQVNLGFLERNEGNLEQAREFLAGALESSSRSQGLIHDTTRGAASGLASVLRRQGELEPAIDVLSPVLEAYRDSETRQDSSYLVLLNDLGLIQWNAGELHKAAATFEECLELSDTARTRPSDSDRSLIANLANVWADLGRFEEAAEAYDRLLRQEEQQLGEAHPSLHIHLFNAGGIELDRGSSERAAVLLGRLLGLLREHDPQPVRMMQTGARLALAHYRLDELAKAEELWLEAWDIASSSDRPDGRFLSSVAGNLAQIYERREDFESQRRWQDLSEHPNDP